MLNIKISQEDLKNLKTFLMRIEMKGTEAAAFYRVFIALDGAQPIASQTPVVQTLDAKVKTEKKKK